MVAASSSWLIDTFVGGERTGFLDESPVAVGPLTHEVVARGEHVLDGGAPGGPGTGDLRPVFAALHGRSILAP